MAFFFIQLGYPSHNETIKKSFWFDSGIHAREWTTINTAIYTIQKVQFIYFSNFEYVFVRNLI
jgi:hypothetical protein